jgi:hypothetical protein
VGEKVPLNPPNPRTIEISRFFVAPVVPSRCGDAEVVPNAFATGGPVRRLSPLQFIQREDFKMLIIENADPDNDRNDFPSGRQISKDGSGLFWNFVSGMYGSEPVHFEPVDTALEKMRANIRHYAGQQKAPPQLRRNFLDVAGGWLAAKVAPKPDAPSAAPVASFPEGMRANLPEIPVKAPTPRERATAWLLEQLSTGPMQAPEVERRVKESGLALKTARRAFKTMGGKPQRKSGAWWWMLPVQDDQERGGT